MPDLEGEELISLKTNLLEGSNRLLEAFDWIEDGDVSSDAKLAVVEAHERLMEVHNVFKSLANRQLMTRY